VLDKRHQGVTNNTIVPFCVITSARPGAVVAIITRSDRGAGLGGPPGREIRPARLPGHGPSARNGLGELPSRHPLRNIASMITPRITGSRRHELPSRQNLPAKSLAWLSSCLSKRIRYSSACVTTTCHGENEMRRTDIVRFWWAPRYCNLPSSIAR
jgi:hypothetical protein